MHTPGSSISGYIFIFLIQIIFLIVFAFVTRYGDGLLPEDPESMEEEKIHRMSYPRDYKIFNFYVIWANIN